MVSPSDSAAEVPSLDPKYALVR
jgi:hypothetical protein